MVAKSLRSRLKQKQKRFRKFDLLSRHKMSFNMQSAARILSANHENNMVLLQSQNRLLKSFLTQACKEVSEVSAENDRLRKELTANPVVVAAPGTAKRLKGVSKRRKRVRRNYKKMKQELQNEINSWLSKSKIRSNFVSELEATLFRRSSEPVVAPPPSTKSGRKKFKRARKSLGTFLRSHKRRAAPEPDFVVIEKTECQDFDFDFCDVPEGIPVTPSVEVGKKLNAAIACIKQKKYQLKKTRKGVKTAEFTVSKSSAFTQALDRISERRKYFVPEDEASSDVEGYE